MYYISNKEVLVNSDTQMMSNQLWIHVLLLEHVTLW